MSQQKREELLACVGSLFGDKAVSLLRSRGTEETWVLLEDTYRECILSGIDYWFTIARESGDTSEDLTNDLEQMMMGCQEGQRLYIGLNALELKRHANICSDCLALLERAQFIPLQNMLNATLDPQYPEGKTLSAEERLLLAFFGPRIEFQK